MKIDYVSDLHIDHHWQRTKLIDPTGPRFQDKYGNALYFDWEWYQRKNVELGNILIIAGDTSNNPDLTIKVVNQASDLYDYVFFIDGNHEHYNKKLYSENIKLFEDHYSQNYSSNYLNQNNPCKIVERTAFLGACGWYDWRCYEDEGFAASEAKEDWKRGLNDKCIIFDQGDPEVLAFRDAKILSDKVSKLQNDDNIDNIVIITHSSPLKTLMVVSQDPFWNRLTPSFVNTQMSNVIKVDVKNKIKYWIYGHTHFRKTEKISNITFLNNAYGYIGEFPNEVWTLKQIEM